MKYEDIRRRLIEMFSRHGCGDPEALADETINRVTRKVQELLSTYEGNPVLYFYGVAKNVAQEQSRRDYGVPRVVPLADPAVGPDVSVDEADNLYAALDKCMSYLPESDRRLILEYYAYKKMEKVNRRKDLANEFNVSQVTLRKRVQRIREHLRWCMEEELARRVDG